MELASCLDAELFVLAVAHLPKPATIVEVHASFDDARERYTAAMDKLVRRARENGIRITTEIAAGHPAQQILRHMETDGIDMVFLGHHSGFALSTLVASTSERVLKHAHCPVVIVR